ncbi:MAG: nucleotidyl transferase AbiEii/AbiGii toxin family protein [Alphaproteobacteria bacterium]|nr:nucleotidyl transferase AbiEii/AbiGii toxin family protein [Alphaproteobacteria bacterium]
MPQFIKLSQPEKNELIVRASSKLHISPVLVEKDFWVSWLLNKIFQHEISKDITFKGGTSLSKCYGIISRFSEDIDLTIDRKIFNNPENEGSLSNKGLQRLIESNDKHASDFVNQIFKPILESIFTLELGEVG